MGATEINQHVIGIVLETDEEMILNLGELQRNTNVVIRGAPGTIRGPPADSVISLSVHRLISAEIPPHSAMLQQSLCDSLMAWGAKVDQATAERLRDRACASCKKPPPVINKPEPLQLQRDPVRVASCRILQHESYIKPDVYEFIGRLRLFRVDKLDIEDKHVILPFVPATFPCNDLITSLQSFCSKKTIIVIMSEDTNQTDYYHALFSFRNIREAQDFSQSLDGQMISSSGEEPAVVRYKLTPIPVRFIHAVPYVDRIDASGSMEIPTCPACLSVLDETILNWPSTPLALEGPNVRHSFGCPARVSASYTSAHCSACEETDDLWLCMICGNVACSRYKRSHGINHCSCTGHSLTIKLSTFDSENPFVWDYVTDRCVQRLSVPLQAKLSVEESTKCQEMQSSNERVEEPPELSPAAEEKKAMSILELNAMYTSALEHTDQMHEVMIRDLEETYKQAEAALESELEELKKRWEKNIGGEHGAAQKLARRKEFLLMKQKNLEEEKEMKQCLENNLAQKRCELERRRTERDRAKEELQKLVAETDGMMARLGML